MKRTKVTTVFELVTALGGLTQAASAMGTTTQNVWNWREAKKLPAAKFLTQKALLTELRIDAPDELWFVASGTEKAA